MTSGLKNRWPRRAAYGRVILYVTWLTLMAGAARAEKPELTSAPAERDLERAEIQHVVRRLSHPCAEVRKQALHELKCLPAERLDLLVQQFHDAEDFEVQRSLRYVTEYVYFRRQMAGGVGFLGFQPQLAQEVPDPETGQLVECVRVVNVLEGFAADKAGLQRGDLILEFDGRPVAQLFKTPNPLFEQQTALLRRQSRVMREGDRKIGSFTAAVKKRSPGSEIALRILRPGSTVQVQVTGRVDSPLAIIDGARLTSAPSGHFLVEYVDPSSKAFAFGVRGGDLLREVNGEHLPTRIGRKKLEEELRRLIPADPEKTVPVQLTVVRRQMNELSIALTLDGRPMDMLNPLDRYMAQARFANWWQAKGGELRLADGMPVRWRGFEMSPRRMPDLSDPPVLP